MSCVQHFLKKKLHSLDYDTKPTIKMYTVRLFGSYTHYFTVEMVFQNDWISTTLYFKENINDLEYFCVEKSIFWNVLRVKFFNLFI